MIQVAKTIPLVAIALLLAATPLFAQSDWSAVRPNPMVTLEIRKLVGVLMIVPAVTLFLLYVFRPRPYVLAGVTAWVAASVMVLVLSFDSAPNAADTPDRLSVGRAGCLGIGASPGRKSVAGHAHRSGGPGRKPAVWSAEARLIGSRRGASRRRCRPHDRRSVRCRGLAGPGTADVAGAARVTSDTEAAPGRRDTRVARLVRAAPATRTT